MLRVMLKYGAKSLLMTNSPMYTVTSVSGLDPATATVNLSENALFDGATFNSAKVTSRNIVINFAINAPAERGRIALYDIIKPKRAISVYVSNGTRSVYINGYVESLSVDMFAAKEVGQISILCPYPFFTDTHSPFTATGDETLTAINGGDVETGMIITLTASGGEVVNPMIVNTAQTGRYIRVMTTMLQGDIITINTNTGQRSVTRTRNGVTTNIINLLNLQSTWLQVQTGSNTFRAVLTSGAENLTTSIQYNVLYQGV